MFFEIMIKLKIFYTQIELVRIGSYLPMYLKILFSVKKFIFLLKTKLS